MAFCDELKAYLTGYVRSGDTYTANGAAGMIQEIIAHLKEEDLEITFRMDSGYCDGAILENIESLGGKYAIKRKVYPTLVAQVTDPSITFVASPGPLRVSSGRLSRLVPIHKEVRLLKRSMGFAGVNVARQLTPAFGGFNVN